MVQVHEIKIMKLYPNVVTPKYATEGSAGFDLVAHSFGQMWGRQYPNGQYYGDMTDKSYISLEPHYRLMIQVGYALEIPEGLQLEIRGRSGNSLRKGLVLSHGVGTIDSDYRGEIGFIAYNNSMYDININIGDRIGQGILMPIYKAAFKEVKWLSETIRGSGGFGSTGS